MKKVLISIHPKRCELIFNGQKTIEVRRSFPRQLETPFEALVYCTKAKHIPEDGLYFLPNDKQLYLGCKKKDLGFVCWEGDFRNGKVIGSFVCNGATCCQAYYGEGGEKHLTNTFGIDLKRACLTEDELFDYIIDKNGEIGTGWLWHITAPKLYDKPRELSDYGLTRAPLSWCYVEDEQ